jgi:rod shape-determining protein MreB and related proteins
MFGSVQIRPRGFTLNSNEIQQTLEEPLQGIVSAVRQALERTPPDLGSDVAERGVVLSGGGALDHGPGTFNIR